MPILSINWTGVSVFDNHNHSVIVSYPAPSGVSFGATALNLDTGLYINGTTTSSSLTLTDVSFNTHLQITVVASSGASFIDSKNYVLYTSDGHLTWTSSNLQASDNNDGTASVTWSSIKWDTTSVSSGSYVILDASYVPYPNQSVSGNSAIVSDLSNGNSYTFNVLATISGDSIYSKTTSIINPLLITPPPWSGSNVSVVNNYDGTVTVSWMDPSAAADSYSVVDENDTPYIPQTVIDPTSHIYGISNDITYVFNVWAHYSTNYTGEVYSDTSATILISSGGGGGGNGHVVVSCFLANAPVLTPAGYAPISSLVEGDNVVTGDGRVVAIQRVSHTRVAAGPSVNPYVIPKGLFGATVRLPISPDHRVSTAKGLLEARLLGLEQSVMAGEIDYYNLELPSWSQDTMVVAGVVVEALAPVRRVTMTLGQFKKALVAQYGELTPSMLAKVQKTCRLVAGGRVECPVLPKSSPSTSPSTSL